MIHGGTTANVVPAHASAEIDVRVASQAEEARIDSAFRVARSGHDRYSTHHDGVVQPAADGANSRRSRRSSSKPAQIGRELGLELTEGSTGGGSDGNFTAALGVPTLDGLGARGGGAHADDEHVLVDSLSERAGAAALACSVVLQAGTMIENRARRCNSRRPDHDPAGRNDRRLSRLPGRPAQGVGHQRRGLSRSRSRPWSAPICTAAWFWVRFCRAARPSPCRSPSSGESRAGSASTRS